MELVKIGLTLSMLFHHPLALKPDAFALASWYEDAGATACGFHARFGVANRTLRCGTRVMIFYGRRRVSATVDDRGPYVWPRVWDLNQTTAGALGFSGVHTVGFSIG